MAKFELKFKDSEFDFINIQCEKLLNADLIYIKLGHSNSYTQIKLDKSTAIKFAKTIRTEINKITEQEVKNVN
jgi:hypothetical protein